MEWISIKDRLPGNRRQLLFTDGKFIQKGVFLSVFINQYADFENVFIGDDNSFCVMDAQKITHWMPLPELPK